MARTIEAYLANCRYRRKLKFAGAFPKTATGKIQKNRIVEQYLGKA